jgi:hypothetical protein
VKSAPTNARKNGWKTRYRWAKRASPVAITNPIASGTMLSWTCSQNGSM